MDDDTGLPALVSLMIVDQSIALGERVRVLLWLADVGSAEDFTGRLEYLSEWQ